MASSTEEKSVRPNGIFISYGREDDVTKFVLQLKHDLEANGYSVWLDLESIPAGSDWHGAIGTALQECSAIIPIITQKYLDSRYCMNELYTADGEKKAIFPIVYEDVDLASTESGRGLKYIISGINWTMFRPSKDDYGDSLQKLIKGIDEKDKQLQDRVPLSTSATSNHGGITLTDGTAEITQSESCFPEEMNVCEKAEIPYTHSSLAIPNPIIDELCSDDQEDLAAQMDELKLEIHKEFLKLQKKLIESMTNKGVSPASLVLTLKSHCTVYTANKSVNASIFKEHMKELSEAKDVRDVFSIICNFVCYYNYELLQIIIDMHGTEEDKKNMQQYIQNFSDYCKKIPCVEFHDKCDPPSQSVKSRRTKVKFMLEIPMDSLKGEDVKRIQRNIAKILGIKSSVLYLHQVESGSLIITFIVPTFLLGHLFTLIYDSISTLREEIKIVTLDHDHTETQLDTLRRKQALHEMENGSARLKQGLYQMAVENFTKAMELDPYSAVIPVYRSTARIELQLYADAEEDCSLSISLDDIFTKAYFNRAIARARQGKLEDAIQDYKSVLELEPGHKQADAHLARYEGELRRRARQLKQGLTLPKQPGKAKYDLPTSESTCEGDVCEISSLTSQAAPELEVVKTLSEMEMSIEALLGETVLVSGSTSEVPVTVFETEGSVVGLFFSAIWCPPSRTFTPKLVEWYNRFKKGPNGDFLNIIFISSDEDEESYKEYTAKYKMPWHSVDYKDRERKSKLSSKFKVTAIPTLIFIDGKTGKMITKDGRSIVTDDPDGEQFPWKPKPFTEIVADAKFTDWDQKETIWDHLQGKIIGLFFSALNLPSTEFTHKLVATYNKLKEAGKKFEIIYVSLDESKEDWQEYLAYMPWISLPYGDMHKKDIIKSFDISGIPTLLILDEKCSVITSEGWSYMINDPDGATFPWYVNTLTEYTADEINSTASLIWYVSEGAIGRAKEVLEPVAKEYMSKMTEEMMEIKLMFFLAKEGTDVAEHLREFAKLPKHNPLLAIVDVPQQQVHISDRSEITVENARKFAYDYLRKRLTGRRLS